MKSSLYYFAFVFLVFSACSGNETTLVVEAKEWKKPAIEALNKSKEGLLGIERKIAEETYGKEKAQIYMKYFEKGMASETGAIMIEGQQGRWLELAYWRGFAFRQAFLAGYLSRGTSE